MASIKCCYKCTKRYRNIIKNEDGSVTIDDCHNKCEAYQQERASLDKTNETRRQIKHQHDLIMRDVVRLHDRVHRRK